MIPGLLWETTTSCFSLSWFELRFAISCEPCTWAKVLLRAQAARLKNILAKWSHHCMREALVEGHKPTHLQTITFDMGCVQSKNSTSSAVNWERVPSVIKIYPDCQSTPAEANRPVINFGIPNDIIYSYRSFDNSLYIVSCTSRKTDIDGSLKTDAPFVGGYRR